MIMLIISYTNVCLQIYTASERAVKKKSAVFSADFFTRMYAIENHVIVSSRSAEI